MKNKFVLCSKRIRSLPTDNVNSRVGKPEVMAYVTSKRAAGTALKPYLDDFNDKAKANLKPSAPRGGTKVGSLIDEWIDKILPNRKPGGARAAMSHVRTYILKQLGQVRLLERSLNQHQAFVTAVGLRVDRRKTAKNVYGTSASVLNLGRKWGYPIPKVQKRDIVFPADKKPQQKVFFFDADTAATAMGVATPERTRNSSRCLARQACQFSAVGCRYHLR